MCRFIETIRIEGGRVYNLKAHEERLNRTRSEHFPGSEPLDLELLLAPEPYQVRTRCRIEYGRDIHRIDYIPYTLRLVASLRCVVADALDYRYKYADRSALDRLFARKRGADDILIVRDHFLTDTTICNIALSDGKRWVTPATPLLRGTMRASLLAQGLIEEGDIAVADLGDYQTIRLFNAMIDFGEVELSISEISN